MIDVSVDFVTPPFFEAVLHLWSPEGDCYSISVYVSFVVVIGNS